MNTSTRLVLVTGPTGVGKSNLRKQFEAALCSHSGSEGADDPEVVPFGSVSVKAPGQTAFSWKDTYLQMLGSLQHPFAETNFTAHSIRRTVSDADVPRALTPEAASRASNDRLFRILQRTIKRRRPKALIFDEAHHLLRVGSSQSLLNQLEHLKYIADETETLHVLFGTYELIRLADLSSALIRRREVIHFARYAYESENPIRSLEPFAEAVAVFAGELDSVCDFSLLDEVAYLYQGSVGCVGVLRDWLYRAYQTAASGSPCRITKHTLEQHIFPASDRLELIETARAGEDYFNGRNACEHEYLAKLGFAVSEPKSVAVGVSGDTARRPFTRKPHNDPVGLGHLQLREPLG